MGRVHDGRATSNEWLSVVLGQLERWFITLFNTQPALGPPFPKTPRVLVVDYNPVRQMMTYGLLSHWGITTMLASDGAEAVALSCELEFDLVLMDLRIPLLDGLAATSEIRRFELKHSRARVPVVAYTSCALLGNEPFLQDFGVDAALEKPCDATALIECLLRWCPGNAAVESLRAPVGLGRFRPVGDDAQDMRLDARVRTV